MRRKGCTHNCEEESFPPSLFILEITSFLLESYILLAIRNRSVGVRGISISFYHNSASFEVSLILFRLS